MTNPRVPELDGLRGVAIILVLIGHLNGLDWLRVPLGYGDAGVVMFFVLSGYLITGVLMKLRDMTDKPSAFGVFYARRARRIFPIYYLTIAAAFALGYQPVIENIARLATYTVNYIPGWPLLHLAAASPFWSLSVEEQFYWLWPFVILFLPARLLLPVIASLIGATVIAKYWLALAQAEYSYVFRTVLSCADSLGAGALLAVLGPRATGAIWLALGGVAVTLGALIAREMLHLDPWYAGAEWVGVAYFHGVILITGAAILAQHRLKFLAFAPLRWTGRISYGLYIYHSFVPLMLGVLPMAIPQWVITGATFTLATASWWLIERPILRWRATHDAATESASKLR